MPTTTAKKTKTLQVRVPADLAGMLRLVAHFEAESGADVLDRMLRGPLTAQFESLPAAFRDRHKARARKRD